MKIKRKYRDYFMIVMLGYIIGKTSNHFIEAITLMILLSLWVVTSMCGEE